MAGFGGSVKLTGESEYRQALRNISLNLRETGSQLRSISSAYNNTDKSMSIITSMTYDDSGNLWTMNGWCDNFIVRFNNKNESVNFPHREYSFEKGFYCKYGRCCSCCCM